jgi:Fe2+ transport system protein B
VQKDDEVEQDLYKSVKEAEFNRRKKDNELKKLQDQFVEMKKQNAIQIKQIIAKAFAEEQDFQQKIFKEKAKLDKVTLIIYIELLIFFFSFFIIFIAQ